MNDMRKLMETVKNVERIQLQDVREVHGDSYVAAYLYLNSQGRMKPELSKILSEEINVSYDVAAQMIEAIDAYEDIRESEEFKHVAEDVTEDMFGTTESDAFVSGYHVGREDCQNGQNDVHMALDSWQKSNRSSR